LLIGLGGVVVLVSRTASFGDAPVDTIGALALIVGAISWSVAAPLTRTMPLPADKAMSSAAQMFTGGVMLVVTAMLLGEFRGFHVQAVSAKAWLSLAYLIVAGSIAAFTAYVWLLHHESPTKVGTYAYVNPVVAVAVGYFFGGEPFGLRTLLGTLCVLVSVILITTMPAKKLQSAVTSQLSSTTES
jgi:drug/metabolite transporter (DMT)-like permease